MPAHQARTSFQTGGESNSSPRPQCGQSSPEKQRRQKKRGPISKWNFRRRLINAKQVSIDSHAPDKRRVAVLACALACQDGVSIIINNDVSGISLRYFVRAAHRRVQLRLRVGALEQDMGSGDEVRAATARLARAPLKIHPYQYPPIC